MFREKLYEQFSKIVEKYKLKQLYILPFIPVVFCFTKLFYELSFHDTFFNWFFLISTGSILIITGLLGFVFKKYEKYRKSLFALYIAFILGGIGTLIFCYFQYKLPLLPDDKLVVLIAKFTPVSSGAEEDSENIPHRIEQELQKKQTEGIPLEIKRISKQVLGTNKYSKRDCALKIGSSKEGHAHVILWGDVRKDESELYVTPKITIIKKMENVYDRETEFCTRENNHIDFKEHMAKEISNITTFVCGLAYYEAKKWDEAIQIFDQIPSDESQFYKGLCLYNRAFTTEQPKQELLSAYRIFYNIFEPKKSDLSKFEEELYFEVQRRLVQTLIELSNLTEPQIGLDYLHNAENISGPIYNYLAESIQKDKNSRLNNFLNLYLAHEDLGIVLSRLGVMLSGDEGNSYLEEAVKIYSTEQINILQKLVHPQWQASILNQLGMVFHKLGLRLGADKGKEYVEKAVETIRNALQILQKNKLVIKGDMTYYNFGLVLSDLGEMIGGEEGIKHLKEAEETLGKSLELNDEHEFRYRWAVIQNLLGKVFYSRSRIVNDNKEDLLLKSIDKFRKALTVFDRSNYTRNWADTHYNIGSSLMALGIIINSEKSLDYFNEAISNFNDSLSVYKGAVNTETYTLILKKTSNAYYNWGIALNNLGIFDKAIEKFEKATEIDPQLADAYSNWGAALTHFRKYDESIEKFRKAIEINPQHAIAYYNWGIALNNLGMFDKAIEKFEKATEINPQIADYYSDWGSVLLKQGKLNEAIEKFKKATEINPQLAIAYYNWGTALNNLGMFDKAIEKFEKATEINPKIVDYYSGWGIALFNLGKYDKAIEPFKKAI